MLVLWPEKLFGLWMKATIKYTYIHEDLVSVYPPAVYMLALYKPSENRNSVAMFKQPTETSTSHKTLQFFKPIIVFPTQSHAALTLPSFDILSASVSYM